MKSMCTALIQIFAQPFVGLLIPLLLISNTTNASWLEISNHSNLDVYIDHKSPTCYGYTILDTSIPIKPWTTKGFHVWYDEKCGHHPKHLPPFELNLSSGDGKCASDPIGTIRGVQKEDGSANDFQISLTGSRNNNCQKVYRRSNGCIVVCDNGDNQCKTYPCQ